MESAFCGSRLHPSHKGSSSRICRCPTLVRSLGRPQRTSRVQKPAQPRPAAQLVHACLHQRRLVPSGLAGRVVKACSAADGSAALADGTPAWLRRLEKAGQEQFLPFALVAGMALGLMAPGPGVRAASANLQMFATSGIFVLSGLGLRRQEAAEALSSWGAALFGLLSILAFSPLLGVLALRLPLQPPELAFGLAVFCCVPCTLSSGVSLTQAIGGNTALALLLTIGSNLLGILTMPFVLCAVLGAGDVASAIKPVALLITLVQSILVPLSIGAAARAFVPRVKAAADANKKRLGFLSGILLALVPWMQVSKAVKQNVHMPLKGLLAVVAAGAGIHCLMLAFNLAAVHLLKLGGPSEEGKGKRRAVVLVASTKTLPIAVTVLSRLSNLMDGPLGLATIPCVCTHLIQILLDSLLLNVWREQDKRTVGGSSMPTDEFVTKVSRNF